MTDVQIRIHGLKELAAAFKQIDSSVAKEFQRGLKGVAESLAGAIRAKVPGSAGGAIRARATQKSVGIAFPAGEAEGFYDYYPWLDFGGSTGKGHVVGSPWSGSVRRENPKGGRYVYPTISEQGPAITAAVGDVVIAVAKSAGFIVNG